MEVKNDKSLLTIVFLGVSMFPSASGASHVGNLSRLTSCRTRLRSAVPVPANGWRSQGRSGPRNPHIDGNDGKIGKDLEGSCLEID